QGGLRLVRHEDSHAPALLVLGLLLLSATRSDARGHGHGRGDGHGGGHRHFHHSPQGGGVIGVAPWWWSRRIHTGGYYPAPYCLYRPPPVIVSQLPVYIQQPPPPVLPAPEVYCTVRAPRPTTPRCRPAPRRGSRSHRGRRRGWTPAPRRTTRAAGAIPVRALS